MRHLGDKKHESPATLGELIDQLAELDYKEESLPGLAPWSAPALSYDHPIRRIFRKRDLLQSLRPTGFV